MRSFFSLPWLGSFLPPEGNRPGKALTKGFLRSGGSKGWMKAGGLKDP